MTPEMTDAEKIEAIRAKCVEAGVPDPYRVGQITDGFCTAKIWRPIRLADVLLALQSKFDENEYIRKFRPFLGPIDDERFVDRLWNLRRDSLDDQSTKCLSFLHSLLCK